MLYYMGKEFDKEKNKEYKTLDGAKNAAKKADLSVYDEEGVKVYPLKVEETDDVPDGALEEEVAEAESEIAQEDIEAAAAAGREEEEVHGTIRRIFDGKLRMRRKPSFEDGAVCGVSAFDAKEVTKKAVTDGKILYKTTDGYWVSGDPAHVEFIPDPGE